MYVNNGVPIQLGQLGIYRDDSMDKIPVGSLYDARNITVRNGLLQKASGSARMNPSAIPMGVKSATWWKSDDVNPRFVMGGGDGKVYYYQYPKIQKEITAESGSSVTLLINENSHFLVGGGEQANAPRKIFILTGQSEVQVITGTETTRRAIPSNKRALDWSGTNQPSYGIIYQNRNILFGNKNRPHSIYISSATDHEDFQSDASEVLDIFPGEGQGLLTAFTYKGRLFLVKRPGGLYYVDISSADVTQWTAQKSIASFTAASPHSGMEILDDALICNAAGNVTSLEATLAFGSVANADLFSNMRIKSYPQIFCDDRANKNRWITFYEYRQEVLITYRSMDSTVNNQLCVIDVSQPNTPKVIWHDSMQANCLGSYQDRNNIGRPFYGCDDGFIYNYDIQVNPNVNGETYTAFFLTPAYDFGFADAGLAEKNKTFQFLEVTYEPTGRWILQCDTYIDGKYYETLSFNMSYGPVLDDFKLDVDRLSGRIQRSVRLPLHGMGRNISFKFYNMNDDEYFKVSKIKVYFAAAGEQQRGEKE